MDTDLVVGDYARSRGISETNVKKYIREEAWELRQNPRDARQRLLDASQQLHLDHKYGLTVQPVAQAIPKVQAYERSPEIAEVIIQGQLVDADSSYSQLATVEDNPYLAAINQRLAQATQFNLVQFAQVEQQALAGNDLDAALYSLEEQEAIQRGQQKAIRLSQLEQAAFRDAQTKIKMAQAGLAAPTVPVPNVPAASPAATQPAPVEPQYSVPQQFPC
jgi:site-specific recombinase